LLAELATVRNLTTKTKRVYQNLTNAFSAPALCGGSATRRCDKQNYQTVKKFAAFFYIWYPSHDNTMSNRENPKLNGAHFYVKSIQLV
jgi:hypothetical protein